MPRWGTGAVGNSAVGHGGAIQGVPQGIYEESATQQAPIGTKLELEDGRIFRYASFAGAAVNRGIMTSTDVSVTCAVEMNAAPDAAYAAGVKVVTLDNAALASRAADIFAGGYLHITDDDGKGYTYRIKGNTASSSNAVTFTLYDGLQAALVAANTDAAITGNKWSTLRISDATDSNKVDYIPAGVTPISFTASYYGWVQTKGIATVLADGTIAEGDNLTLSDGTDGSVQTQDAYTEALVGIATFAPDSGGHVGIDLRLE